MININDLHIQASVQLIFMCNSIANHGRSNKTYSINIVNDSHNDNLLNNIFSSKSNRTVKYDATYMVDGILISGVLMINNILKTHATAVFVSGNGKLWESIENKKLSDYDWSAFSHYLDVKAVTDSEYIGSPYIYDVCDRGRFMNDAVYSYVYELPSNIRRAKITQFASIDICERFPAINILEMIKTILNQEGVGVRTSNFYNNYYLLFTNDHKIRNSAEWEKSAIFYADQLTGVSGSDTTATIDWTQIMSFSHEDTDNGNNFDGTKYVIPETGSYRFQMNVNFFFEVLEGALDTEVFTVQLVKNYGASLVVLAETDFTGDDLTDRQKLVQFDTMMMEFDAQDEVYIQVRWQAEYFGDSWNVYIGYVDSSSFFNSVYRYYSAGSYVDFSKLMPDMNVSEFFSKVFKYLNLYTFYSENKKTIDIEQGRRIGDVFDSINAIENQEQLTEKVNYWLEFSTDKTPLLDNIFIDNNCQKNESIRFDLSRTFISDSFRVFNTKDVTIPVLWKSGDPENWTTASEVPPFESKSKMRILEYEGQQVGSYKMTYGGSVSANYLTMSGVPKFSEILIDELYVYELRVMEGASLEIIAQVDIYYLNNNDMFKKQIFVNGFGAYWLEEATQLSGNIYKLKLIK